MNPRGKTESSALTGQTNSTRFVFIAAALAAVGGLLFGYDTGVISGALLFIKTQFHLSVFHQELVVSVVLIGATVAALSGGKLADAFGRRLMLLVTAVLLLIVGLKSSFGLVPGPRPISQLGVKVSLNLIGAVLLTLYGVIALMTHRHPFKMVLGVMFMEMGIQMILVNLVPGLLAMVQIGILSNFVGSIFVILYVNRLIVERLKVTDTTELSELKY